MLRTKRIYLGVVTALQGVRCHNASVPMNRTAYGIDDGGKSFVVGSEFSGVALWARCAKQMVTVPERRCFVLPVRGEIESRGRNRYTNLGLILEISSSI